jgi:hypothetical protein
MHFQHAFGKETTMRIELSGGAVQLARGQSLKVRDGAGSTIRARRGALWITEERSAQDVVLAEGHAFRLERPGLAIVQAFRDAAIVIE